MCFPQQCIINKQSKKFCVSGIWNCHSSYLMQMSVIDELLFVNWIKWVLQRFSESTFASNYIFICLKTMLISFCCLDL